MSTRRTRQELIEQGVLKEVADNGKSDSSDVSAPCCFYLTAAGQRLSHPHTVHNQYIRAGALYSKTTGVGDIFFFFF